MSNTNTNTNINYYISFNNYINVKDYKIFLRNIYKNLEFDKNIFEIPIFKNKNMCNCNINSLSNIKHLTRGTNEIYTANIKKTCISNSTFFSNKVDKIILKVCNGFGDDDDDNEYECLYTNELITSILYSNLVINNITSNLLLLFGYMNNCKLDNLLENKKNESVLFNSYVNGNIFKNLKSKLNMRQVFELFYTIICCYASFGYCIVDINLENFMTKKDSFNTVIKIYDRMFYFESYNSVCIIDYQTDNNPETIVNLKKYIYAISKLLDDNVKNELLEINSGNYIYVMRQFINCKCFKPYVIYNKNKCKKYRDIVFDVVKVPSIKSLNKKKSLLKSKVFSRKSFSKMKSKTSTRKSKTSTRKSKVSSKTSKIYSKLFTNNNLLKKTHKLLSVFRE
tara:strand:+ start:15090 stop:16274 length:1185 start_codon:yes stop_codon:yes gene_type:complete